MKQRGLRLRLDIFVYPSPSSSPPTRASLYEPKTAQLGLTSLHQIPFLRLFKLQITVMQRGKLSRQSVSVSIGIIPVAGNKVGMAHNI